MAWRDHALRWHGIHHFLGTARARRVAQWLALADVLEVDRACKIQKLNTLIGVYTEFKSWPSPFGLFVFVTQEPEGDHMYSRRTPSVRAGEWLVKSWLYTPPAACR